MGIDRKMMQQTLGRWQETSKKLNKNRSNCLIPSCNHKTINSHFLQRNGILNNLVEEGCLVQLIPNDYFSIEKDGYVSFKKLGVKKTFSDYLFCNEHDTKIFKPIEVGSIDFSKYPHQLLFSYRSLCGEFRKKMKNIEFFIEMKKHIKSIVSIRKPDTYSNIVDTNIDILINGSELGKRHLTFFKSELEDEILKNGKSRFTFKTLEYPLVKICASAVFSPLQHDSIDKALEGKCLNYVFVNVIPQIDRLYIIIGYHNDYSDDFITDYMKSWECLDDISLQKQLTNLLTTRVETWGVSPSLFKQIPKDSLRKFKDYWNNNILNLSSDQQVDFNLFENTN